MPGKWGARIDPPMQYVPKYHQKLGCQANGGAHRSNENGEFSVTQ